MVPDRTVRVSANSPYTCYDCGMRTLTQRELRNESAAILREIQPVRA